MSAQIDYSELIPNNVNLASDRKLQRALERWHPKFMEWWKGRGPEYYQDKEVYLRTAISVDKKGWAHFDYVKMPDYRWGIFLAEGDQDKKINTLIMLIVLIEYIIIKDQKVYLKVLYYKVYNMLYF